jgi:DNA-binding SARP family transcriptional activator/TolB-like protein/Tfp pilus assembly protein PilF
MVELRTLGNVHLRAADGRMLHSVLTQPKRVALLAYLACGADDFHRRDTVVGLLWPELDQEKARAALRQAVFHLRRSLGEGVILSHGDAELGINPAQLGCDAVQFRQALETQHWERALELYRGDFLEGFHLAEVPQFERWMEDRRRRLRQEAVEAAGHLAEAAERRGDLEEAKRWGQRALEIAWDDETAIRRIVTLFDRLGDRPGAIRAYGQFAERLRAEYDLEPSAETRALVEEIRFPKEEVGTAPAARVASPSGDALPWAETAPAPAGLPNPVEEAAIVTAPPAPQGHPSRTWESGRWRLAVLAGALSLPLLAGIFFYWHASRPVSPTDDHRVAIFPFAVHGSTEVSYLEDGMVDLLSTNFQGAGAFRSVDPHALLSSIQREEPGPLSPARAQAAAGRFGAGLFVLGDIVEAEGRLRISAALYAQDRSGEPLARANIEGQAASLFELVDQLTAQLLAQRLQTPGAALTPLASVTTSSFPALKRYLQGEQHFRNQQYAEAVAAFQDALAADSTFALAAYRLSVTADWVGNNALSGEAAERAARFGSRLPEADRALVDALVAFNDLAPGPAKRLYRGVLARRPHDVEAWYRLAETEYHHNALIGLDPALSRAAFRRALELDPEHQPARTHLARLASGAGDARSFDALVPPLLANAPGDSLPWLHLRALALGDHAAQVRFAPVYETASDSLLWMLARDGALYTRNFGGAQAVARRLTRPDRSRELRVAGHLLSAWMEMVRGRPRAADRELDAVARLDPPAALEYRAVFATPHFLPVPAERLRAIRDSVAAWEGTAAENPYLRLYTDMWPSIRHYLLGLLSARLRDEEGVRRHLGELRPRESTPPAGRRLLAQRAAAVRARQAAERGDAATALALLQREQFEGLAQERFPSVNQFERHLRPGLLRRLGRQEEALRWYGALPWRGSAYEEETLWDLVYQAPFLFERGEMLEKMGRPKEAAAHYARFIELWRDAEPELRPRVVEARRRLARMRRGGH